MKNRIQISAFLFMLFSTCSSFSQSGVRGIVTDNWGNPVMGAIVSMSGKAIVCTTGTDGHFAFKPTGICSFSDYKTGSAHAIQMSKKSIILKNPKAQEVSISIFNLHGKLITRLHKGTLHSGQYNFSLPQFNKDQVFIVQCQIGSIRETFSTTGVFPSNVFLNLHRKPEGHRNAFVTFGQISVSHNLYDSKTVIVNTPDDSLNVRLNSKLKFNEINKIKVGDTVSLASEGISMFLDSIVDQRCPCDVLCGLAGEAFIYLTVIKNGVTHAVKLQYYQEPDKNVDGLDISIEKMDSCHQDLQKDYTLEAKISYSTNLNKILFIEHFETVSGTAVSGACAMINIDFPTYSFNKDSQILKTLQSNKVNDFTRIILGDGLSLNGDAGAGIASSLSFYSSLPLSNNNDFTVEEIGIDGSVKVSYKGKLVAVSTGESVTIDTSFVDENEEGCKTNLNIIDRFTNYGYLSLSQIQGY